MNVRSTALATALAIAAAAPAAASAAQIHTDRGCYQDHTGAIIVSGNGFEPNQPFSVSLDGTALNTHGATTDTTGAITDGSIQTPRLSRDAVHTYTLTVTQGANTATTTFSVTPFLADFTPGSGNPKTLRVRFKIFGFGLPQGGTPPVYLHYVRPNGKVRRTIRLGRAQGTCGQISRTARKKLFPFRAEGGTWRLQFDTHKRYRKGKAGVDFLYYTISVTIKKVFG